MDDFGAVEITREDRVAGAGFDPQTFTGGRTLRILSGGLKRASEVYVLALDRAESAQDVVELFTKPTKRLLDECEFAVHRSSGPLLIYARELFAGSSELAEKLLAVDVAPSEGAASIGPFSEEVMARTDIVLTGFRSVVEDAVEVIGLVQTHPREFALAQGIAEAFLDELIHSIGSARGPVETFHTGWATPVSHALVFRKPPRAI